MSAKNKAQENHKLALFQGKKVRRILVGDEWFFSIIDVIEILTNSANARRYWSDLKRKIVSEGYTQLYENIVQLKLVSSDGKKYATDCANTEIMFRIIQSIPSKKAEPFKRWLAKVGKDRIDEIEDPELAVQRTKEIYEKKGYPKDWIEKRMRGISVRHKLTDEWFSRGAQTRREYAILTNEIMRGTFDLQVDEYKSHKGLGRENLRDHMTDLELILTMLGEAATTQISNDRDSEGFNKLQKDAVDGGSIAGRARKDIEEQTGKKVVSKDNFLPGK